MPVDEKKQPIIVKKVKKGGAGHHGGAWKVAYADFVTAMMAFFLLMWLLGSTTRSERAGISNFFKNPSAVQGPGGSSTSMIKLGGSMTLPQGKEEPLHNNPKTPSAREKAADKKRLDRLMLSLKKAVERNPALRKFKDQLLIDITPEGLRIQIVDKAGRPMFKIGSARLEPYTRKILDALAKIINEVPNRISISGHTDARRYGLDANYTNWELSADRANAARRQMVHGGMAPKKIGRVVGLASSVPYDRQHPDAPVNRRISILVMNRQTEEAIGLLGPVKKKKASPAGAGTAKKGASPKAALPASAATGAAPASATSGLGPVKAAPAPTEAKSKSAKAPATPMSPAAAPTTAPPAPASVPNKAPPPATPSGPSSAQGESGSGAPAGSVAAGKGGRGAGALRPSTAASQQQLEQMFEKVLGPPPKKK